MMKVDDIEEILNNRIDNKKKYVNRIEKSNYFKKNSINSILRKIL